MVTDQPPVRKAPPAPPAPYPVMPMYPIPGWVQVAPYPADTRKKATAMEVASVIIGILAMCIHWVALFSWGLYVFYIPLILSVLAVVFGFISVHRLFRKEYQRENGEGTAGLAGLSLGILALMFTVAWLVFAQTYLWGWGA
ncbi:MAG: hypothetical protein PHU53_06295 [Thermoplasmata archaeon]|nr:hypothetical protein [Thermoplasmata archaeon]